MSSWENVSRGDFSVMVAELFFLRRIFTTLKLCLRGWREPKKSINQCFWKSWTLTSLEKLSAVSQLLPADQTYWRLEPAGVGKGGWAAAVFSPEEIIRSSAFSQPGRICPPPCEGHIPILQHNTRTSTTVALFLSNVCRPLEYEKKLYKRSNKTNLLFHRACSRAWSHSDKSRRQ